MTTPDARKLLLGSLLIGASAAPLGGVLTGVLAGIGGNWLSEAIGSVLSAGPPLIAGPADGKNSIARRSIAGTGARIKAAGRIVNASPPI